jgi:K+-transporting ATPase ATPase C chain
MKNEARPALVMLALFSVLTGLVYPALVTLVAQIALPWQANGSLVVGARGEVLGSALVGQAFSSDGYFWGRPSACGDDGAASAASNLGPTNPVLVEAVRARVDALRAVEPGRGALVPVDLVTSSASGLDPDITPAAALYQVPRVARARGLSEERVTDLVRSHVEARVLGILGEPRVNVLSLNLALDGLHRPSS